MRHSVLASVLVSAVSVGASVALAGAQASRGRPCRGRIRGGAGWSRWRRPPGWRRLRSAHQGALGTARDSRRDDRGQGEGSQLEGSAPGLGPPGPGRHLDQRRHARHSHLAPAGAGQPRIAHARGVRPSGRRRRGVARPRRERGNVPAERVRGPHLRLHLVRRRAGRRPPPGADAGRPRQAEGLVRRRHLRHPAVQQLRGFLALRPLHHARRRRRVSRCSTATASASRRPPTRS